MVKLTNTQKEKIITTFWKDNVECDNNQTLEEFMKEYPKDFYIDYQPSISIDPYNFVITHGEEPFEWYSITQIIEDLSVDIYERLKAEVNTKTNNLDAYNY